MLRAFLTEVRSLAKRVAPHSSNRGMDNGLIGATLVFAVTRAQVGDSVWYVALTYTTAAYALAEASQKPCS